MAKKKKNKDIYNLNDLDVNVGYLTNGCGKRLETPVFIDIKKGDEYIIKGKSINLKPLKWLLNWLEEEVDENKIDKN